ncbi:hypothetical protein D3H64_06000 [Atopobacter sp. AH10]|uniref:hypothetical protein n=1 Tax=Atopobacter sp. AH10 TaxID=2315861 RepID=UPI000EF1E1EB|nr:hypothetical protein [Atopobacter sp. AH10]RLK63144.1 hypothetical protein D3H64_06000 [Atopobacter sp. AH10]
MKRAGIYVGGKEIVERYIGDKLVYAKIKKLTLKLERTTLSPYANEIKTNSVVIPSEIKKIFKVEIEGYPSYEGEVKPYQYFSAKTPQWQYWDNQWHLYGITFPKDLNEIYHLNGNFMRTGETVTIHYI